MGSHVGREGGNMVRAMRRYGGPGRGNRGTKRGHGSGGGGEEGGSLLWIGCFFALLRCRLWDYSPFERPRLRASSWVSCCPGAGGSGMGGDAAENREMMEVRGWKSEDDENERLRIRR